MAQDTDTQLEDNWCDAGNIWGDGRCSQGSIDEQLWHWTCGWYMQQVDNGYLSLDELRLNLPLCTSIYPPIVTQEDEAPTTGQEVAEVIEVEAPVNMCTDSIDTDCDGLIDQWEIAYFGDLSPTATDDPDGDLCNNLCEQNAGTIPI
ncbi:MAG: hypothetical protein Phog2KO_48580 [Phototrophicaceae bacterium]